MVQLLCKKITPYSLGGDDMHKIYSIDELTSLITPIAKNYGVKRVALFGSYSTGSQNENSDIDLLIDKGDIKGLFMFNGFVNDVSTALQKPIDIMTYSSLSKSLIKDTVNNEVVLYEQS